MSGPSPRGGPGGGGTVSGTEGYAEDAEALARQYESITFADTHRHVLPLLPTAPGNILDIGAGTGRDAAALAALGHRVTAVEPTAEFRTRAMALHPGPGIAWVDDHLPRLARIAAGAAFDAILLTAVWMHLDEGQRRAAMPRLAGLLKPGAPLIFSLRHGPIPKGRRMFDVTDEETIALAAAAGLSLALQRAGGDGAFNRAGVHWSRLGFLSP